MNGEKMWPIWGLAVLWLGYGGLGFYFLLSRNLARKQRLYKPYVIGSGVLFLVVLYLMGFPWFMLLIASPLVAIVTVVNLRSLRFCQHCGATVWSMVPFVRPRHCSACGAPVMPGEVGGGTPGGRAA